MSASAKKNAFATLVAEAVEVLTTDANVSTLLGKPNKTKKTLQDQFFEKVVQDMAEGNYWPDNERKIFLKTYVTKSYGWKQMPSTVQRCIGMEESCRLLLDLKYCLQVFQTF